MSYNLGGVLGGALAPLVATELLASTGTSWSISLYVLAMSAVSFACVFLLSETYLTSPASAPRNVAYSPGRKGERRPARPERPLRGARRRGGPITGRRPCRGRRSGA